MWTASTTVALGCGASAHAFRLNPEQEPEQYRVTCQKRFYYCELEARELCGGEYHELGRLSNRPEQVLVKDSDLSSTGPAKGQGNWEGELTVECGRDLPPLRLERALEDGSGAAGVSAQPSASAAPTPAPALVPPTTERLCVPGVTLACLGPGACKGAQACLETGAGYGPCDCGTTTEAPPDAAGASDAVPSPSAP